MKIDPKVLLVAVVVLLLAFNQPNGCDVLPPVPPTPVPPDPDPVPPDPVPPDPTPDDAPFPADGLTVLIVEETTQRQNLSAGHRAVMTSLLLREWFDSHDVEFRLYDADDANVDGMAPTFRAAYALPRESLPWIGISNGETGFVGPLPDGVAATIRLVGQYE